MSSYDMSRFVAVREKAVKVMELATQLYGVNLSNHSISFKLRGSVAGLAGCKICNMRRLYVLKFNQDIIQGQHYQDLLDNTVPHEVAHLVCFANPKLGRQHDNGWKRVCLALGGNGKRCHDMEVQPVGGGYEYITDQGHKVVVGPRHHIKLQNNYGYYLTFRKGKGKVDRYSRWCKQGEVMPEQPPTPRPTTVVNPWADFITKRPAHVAPVTPAPVHRLATSTASFPANGSKADKVRYWIAIAKREGKGMESVIFTARVELDMTAALATTYVKNNWNKV